jgi:hypothetical protein
VYSKFRKKKVWKKKNLQSPWGMEDSILPSVGASFQKWGCYAHIPQSKPRPLQHARAIKK